MRRKDITSVALLLCVLAAWSCTAQQKQSQHDFFAVLIDTASKKPVPSVRIILAPKKEGKKEGEYECTIDTSLTAVSNDRGEVRIPNAVPGEYVVFQIPSGIIKPELNGRVVTWGGGSAPGYNFSFGGVEVKKGTLAISGGHMVIVDGYMEGYVGPGDGVLGISTTTEGAILTVRVPGAGSTPVKIEINTALSKPSPPQAAPKTGQ